MKKVYIPVLVILVILILKFEFSFDFHPTASAGWHLTIFPDYYLASIVFIIGLMFLAIAFWLKSNKADKINWSLFGFHFLITIPGLVFMKFPFLFLNPQLMPRDTFLRAVPTYTVLTSYTYSALLIAQILFLIYFMRVITQKPLKR